MTKYTRDIQAILSEEVVPQDTDRYGVVIGIESYADRRLALRCARRDAKAMYELMIDPDCGMFRPANVALLLDESARKEAIWNALASLRRKADRGDTVWIYYAGHGAMEGGDFYWVPYDGNVDDLYATGLARSQIAQVLDDIPAERVVAFLDCCHAAATAIQKVRARVALTGRKLLSGYTGKGRVILAASDCKEKSVELPKEGYGAFTYYLLKGLRGEADLNRAGVVHLDSLWAYLEEKVYEASKQLGNPQQPMLLGQHSHKLPLTLNPLEVSRKREIAERIRALVGLDDNQLTTEEARTCLRILRYGPQTDAERDVAAEFESLTNDRLRMSTFKRLVQAAITSSPRRRAGTVTMEPAGQPAPPTPAAGPDTATTEPVGTLVELDEIRRQHVLDDHEALRIIDNWSVEHPEYLNPLSRHARLMECTNWAAWHVTITALVETRTAKLRSEPFHGDASAVRTQRLDDKWSVPIPEPREFTQATETWVAQAPHRIRTCDSCGGKGEVICDECKGAEQPMRCPECKGTGKWVCPTCRGTGKVQCSKCIGTGKKRYSDGTYDSIDKCEYCFGKGTVPCPECKGTPKHICDKCAGQGKYTCETCRGRGTVACQACSSAGLFAEIPVVTASFSVETSTTCITELPVTEQGPVITESAERMPWLVHITEEGSLPGAVDALPAVVSRQIHQHWQAFRNATKGRVRRMKLEIGYTPCTTCRLKGPSTTFDMYVIGPDHRVVPGLGVPKDQAYIARESAKRKLEEKITECRSAKAKARKTEKGAAISAAVSLAGAAVGLVLFPFIAPEYSAERLVAVVSSILFFISSAVGFYFAWDARNRGRLLDRQEMELTKRITQIDAATPARRGHPESDA